MYQHAREHSNQAGALSNLIAVHNSHNAIEIVLRAILVAFEIRPEKELNIDFESLMNQIDKAPCFEQKSQRLPHRAELRRLNSSRNLVQHHAHEPETSTMEAWRAFSHRFMCRAYTEYFQQDFEKLSAVEFLADDRIRGLMSMSNRYLDERIWSRAVCVAKTTFQYAANALYDGIPTGGVNAAFLLSSDIEDAAGSLAASGAWSATTKNSKVRSASITSKVERGEASTIT